MILRLYNASFVLFLFITFVLQFVTVILLRSAWFYLLTSYSRYRMISSSVAFRSTCFFVLVSIRIVALLIQFLLHC